MTRRAGVMKPDQPEYFIIKNDRYHQQGTSAQALGKETNFVIELRRRGVVESDRLLNIEML